jgi:hypothetical protein
VLKMEPDRDAIDNSALPSCSPYAELTRVFRHSTNLNIKTERRHIGSLRPLPSCVANAAQSSKVCCVCCPFFPPEFQLRTPITIHFQGGS